MLLEWSSPQNSKRFYETKKLRRSKNFIVTHLEIENDVNLAPFTTLKIGGKARYFARALYDDHVVEAVRFVADRNIRLFILGGGSNVLISDEGFDGLALQIAIPGIVREEPINTDKVGLTAGAGEDWDQFVEYCVDHDLAGVECLKNCPKDKGVQVGVLDIRTSMVETPNMVADRVRTIIKGGLKPEQITLSTDCGMKPLARMVSKLKLNALAEGAAIVRKEIKA